MFSSIRCALPRRAFFVSSLSSSSFRWLSTVRNPIRKIENPIHLSEDELGMCLFVVLLCNSSIMKVYLVYNETTLIAIIMITDNRAKNGCLVEMVETFRQHGHHYADLDPLSLHAKEQLNVSSYLKWFEKNATQQVPLKGILHLSDNARASVTEIVEHLKKSYCGKIGVQMTHMEVCLCVCVL
jgi:hypothetical protein